MDKFLFTDGTNGVREVYSPEELFRLLDSLPSPAQSRIWVYSTGEWISFASFTARYKNRLNQVPVTHPRTAAAPVKRKTRYVLPLLMLTAAVITLLVFNFAKAGWTPSGKLVVRAARPDNVPVMDMDSLVNEIEFQRGRMLDKSTRNNLRLRNNWPDQILLKLEAAKESRNGRHRFTGIRVQVDNATGVTLDQAIVKLQGWTQGRLTRADTLRFSRIRYDKVLTRNLDATWTCDSLSISFSEIRSAAFNFCYSSQTKNASGNYNDRWFCREGKPAE